MTALRKRIKKLEDVVRRTEPVMRIVLDAPCEDKPEQERDCESCEFRPVVANPHCPGILVCKPKAEVQRATE